MNRLKLALVGAVVLLANNPLGQAHADYREAVVLDEKPSPEQIERQLIQKVAGARKAKDVTTLTGVPVLKDAVHAFQRQPALEVRDWAWLEKRLKAAGYTPARWMLRRDRGATAFEVFDQWTADPNMKEQIISPFYTDICIVVSMDGETGDYVALAVLSKQFRMPNKK